MKKLGMLVLLGMVVMTLVACGPVRPKTEATDAEVQKAIEWVGTATDAITEAEYDDRYYKSTSVSKDGVETTTTKGEIDGSKTQLKTEMEEVWSDDGKKLVMNGTVEINYNAKSAIFVYKDLTRTRDNDYNYTYSGEVWYVPSDGDGFVATKAEHLEAAYYLY